MPDKKHALLFILSCCFFVLFSGEVEAKPEGTSQKGANIEGFRSTHFGMRELDVVKSISKDFNIKRKNISRFEHPHEKTLSLGIDIENLLPDSGPAKIFYILGHKSRRLIQINIIWVRPVTSTPEAEDVVSIANQLRNHLANKNYQKEGFALNAQLSEGVILVFQGQDNKGHAIKLVLINPKSDPKKMGENISLTLSYIENPGKPDVFHIKDGDF
jgi:hypothetical protein